MRRSHTQDSFLCTNPWYQGVLKSVVVTSCSMTPIPCSVKVEFLPDSPAFGLSPLNSALKAFKSSKKRVVQFGMLSLPSKPQLK